MELFDDVFFEPFFSWTYSEAIELGGVVIPLIKINEYNVIVWGYGENDGLPILAYLLAHGIKPQAVVDADPTKAGKELIEGIHCRHISELKEIVRNATNTMVLVTTSYAYGLELSKIISVLQGVGINNYYVIREDDKKELFGSVRGFASYFYNHKEQLLELYEKLRDKESKETLVAWIQIFFSYNAYQKKQIDDRYKYFFGDNREEIYRHLDDEVWVNCGANRGDSIFQYFSNGLNCKRIFAFEGDMGIYGQLKSNCVLLKEDLKKKVETICEYIDDKTMFKRYLKDERITLINADIEGNELDLLKSMREIIINDRPVLAVCVYHRKDDLVKIPDYITSIVDNYEFALRKYTCFPRQPLLKEELVLYAVPQERYCLV